MIAKEWVRRHVGVLPAHDLRLKVLRLPTTLRLRRAEGLEVSRALERLGSEPTARVATVIPTFRRPEMLRVAVDSALDQTVTDQVVLVVDDGGGLLDLPDDPRVVAVPLSRNYGVPGMVRNVGIRVSRSEYLAFLDDDNRWCPDHLEQSLAAHARGAQLTYTALRRVRPDGSTLDIFSVPFDRAAARDGPFADTSAIVVRRGPGVLFSRTPRPFFPLEDWELAYRLSRRLRVEHVPEPTVEYLVHPGSHLGGPPAPGVPANHEEGSE